MRPSGKWNRRSPNQKVVNCAVCGKVYPNQMVLDAHIARDHSQPTLTPTDASSPIASSEFDDHSAPPGISRD